MDQPERSEHSHREDGEPGAAAAAPADTGDGTGGTAPGWEDGWAGDPNSGDPHTALPPKVEAWRKRSAAGAILTGFALGLQQALETKREDPSIVVQTSGEPPDDLPVEADFEYGRPRQSVVNIRPWLLNDRDKDADDRAGDA